MSMPANQEPASPTLNGLPEELNVMIISVITSQRDLASLNRTCKKQWRLTIKPLYEHFNITDKDWPILDRARSEELLAYIKNVTIIRRNDSNSFFTDHGLRLFKRISKNQLRSVHFLPSADAECPASFIDHILDNQSNLETLDICWPLSYHVPRRACRVPTSSQMLTTITVSVQCVSPTSTARATGGLLAACPNLNHLTLACCIHSRHPDMPEMFEMTARVLRAHHRRLRLKTFNLAGCPRRLNTQVFEFCRIIRGIIDCSDLQTLAVYQAVKDPDIFVQYIANSRRAPVLRDVRVDGISIRGAENPDPGNLGSLQKLWFANVQDKIQVLFEIRRKAERMRHWFT